MTELIEIVKQLGFPIAVCAWFMVRCERKLDAITSTVVNLSHNVSIIAQTIDSPEVEK